MVNGRQPSIVESSIVVATHQISDSVESAAPRSVCHFCDGLTYVIIPATNELVSESATTRI